jgi:hypothetical protein
VTKDGESYTIHMNERWSLADLYVLPHAYEQVYFLIYSLRSDHSEADTKEILNAYATLPWQGGYSAVNFYNKLKHIIKEGDRPIIKSIRYSSPGWIELALVLSIALNVEKIIKSICSSIKTCNDTYDEIMKGMRERKLLRVREETETLRLIKDNHEYVEYCLGRMTKMIDIEGVGDINTRTGHPYRSLKILLSLFRRVQVLSEYQENGKADFSNKR